MPLWCYQLSYFCFLTLISKLLPTWKNWTVKGNCCAVKKDLQLHKSDGSVSSTGNATENSSWSLPPVDCCPLTIIHSQCFSPKLSFLVIIVFGKFPLVANVITESSAWPWAQQYWNLTLQCTWQDVFNCTDWAIQWLSLGCHFHHAILSVLDHCRPLLLNQKQYRQAMEAAEDYDSQPTLHLWQLGGKDITLQRYQRARVTLSKISQSFVLQGGQRCQWCTQQREVGRLEEEVAASGAACCSSTGLTTSASSFPPTNTHWIVASMSGNW